MRRVPAAQGHLGTSVGGRGASSTSLHRAPTEEGFWFGPVERSLYGWLVRPVHEEVRGGVVLVPAIGLEGHPARRAMRHLASHLAELGFVSLRVDVDGTGDSCGALNDPHRTSAWMRSVADAADLLRGLDLPWIAAVGLRLGATIVCAAAATSEVDLDALVLWDPCESGGSFVRECRAFEALRGVQRAGGGRGLETSEFVLSEETVRDLSSLSPANLGSGPAAKRTLVISRVDRKISEKLRARLEQGPVTWETTTTQAAMFDVDPFKAVLPLQTLNRISAWLSKDAPARRSVDLAAGMAPQVRRELSLDASTERVVQLGSRRLFGIVSDPIGGAHGPLVVMVNVSKGNHTGPARCWVELSRRLARHGLRCVRFDLSGLGDSPWPQGDPDPHLYDARWNEDVVEVVRQLEPEDPSAAVLVGLCSGAFLAIEGAWALGARGACAINPPVNLDLLHATARMGRSAHPPVRTIASALNEAVLRMRWSAAAAWAVCRALLPAGLAVDLADATARNGTQLLVLESAEDVSPYADVPFLRSVDRHRWFDPKRYPVELVPDLDHSMHRVAGRDRSLAIVEQFVLSHFAERRC